MSYSFEWRTQSHLFNTDSYTFNLLFNFLGRLDFRPFIKHLKVRKALNLFYDNKKKTMMKMYKDCILLTEVFFINKHYCITWRIKCKHSILQKKKLRKFSFKENVTNHYNKNKTTYIHVCYILMFSIENNSQF